VDSQGKEIKELTTPAEITLRLPDEFQPGGAKAGTYAAGGFIEWWSYDETIAAWIREDADPTTPALDDALIVLIDGFLYAKAKVKHFTFWNVDRPVTEHACICVKVVDGSGNPFVNAEVMASGVTYNGNSKTAITGADGKACVTMKRTTDTNKPEKVKITARSGSVVFEYNVTDSSEHLLSTFGIPQEAQSTEKPELVWN
jgi:hypothetical protein